MRGAPLSRAGARPHRMQLAFALFKSPLKRRPRTRRGFALINRFAWFGFRRNSIRRKQRRRPPCSSAARPLSRTHGHRTPRRARPHRRSRGNESARAHSRRGRSGPSYDRNSARSWPRCRRMNSRSCRCRANRRRWPWHHWRQWIRSADPRRRRGSCACRCSRRVARSSSSLRRNRSRCCGLRRHCSRSSRWSRRRRRSNFCSGRGSRNRSNGGHNLRRGNIRYGVHHCRGRGSRRPHPRSFGGRIFRGLIGNGFGLRRSFGVSQLMKVFSDFYRGGFIDRTRMGFLLGDASLGQIVQNRFGLHFEFAGQFVDANLRLFSHPLTLLLPFA